MAGSAGHTQPSEKEQMKLPFEASTPPGQLGGEAKGEEAETLGSEA
jgi:hypothetical protein